MKRVILVFLLSLGLLLPVRASDAPKYIALTFDDGPSGRYTDRLLDGLAERQVHATFFLCGYRVEQYPALTARIAAEGHEIGSHSDAHSFFNALSTPQLCADLAAAEEKLTAAAGQRPTLLRPPGGIFDLEALRQTSCADLPVILWSVDAQDWCRSDSEAIAADIVKQADSGDVILMHDMKDSSVNAALKVIDRLEARGFEFLTVSELAALTCTPLAGGRAYYQFSFAKNASMASRSAATEPWTKAGFPPPRPLRAAFMALVKARRSPSGAATA